MHTTVDFTFPAADWLDPFDTDEPATQWFFANQDSVSRAWIAPADGTEGWGFAASERMYDVFTNPRSCLYCLEKAAIVCDGTVLREWTPTSLRQEPSPGSCAQHNGLHVVYEQTQQSFPVHEAAKYAAYGDALAAALADRPRGVRVMIARIVHGESLW